MKRKALVWITISLIVSIIAGFLINPRPVSAHRSTENQTDRNPISSHRLFQEITPAETMPVVTVTPSQTVEPPGNYERPVIVVDTYSLDQDTISPGDSFILFVTLYNAGQQYATNIVATFTSGDLIPRQTGGVVAVGEIAPGNHNQFAQPLFLDAYFWGNVALVSMTISYTNETGVSYSEAFSISLPVYLTYSPASTATPTPTQTPIPSSKPQLVIESYSTDISPLQPGSQFNLMLNVKNVGNADARNVTMVVGGGTNSAGEAGTLQPGGISGGSGEFANFAPLGSSNVQSLGDLAMDASLAAQQDLIVNVSTAPGAYPLKISFIYINDQNQTFVDDQVVTLLVYEIPILEISFYQAVSSLFVGQPNLLPIQVVNMGRSSTVLGTMSVSAVSGQLTNNSIFVGNLDQGGYFTLDTTYIPDLAGTTDLLVSVNYTNDFNQPEVITQTLTVEVIDQPIIEPPIDGNPDGGPVIPPQEPETFLHKVWRFILGLIGLDSGLNTGQTINNNQPDGAATPEQPGIIPAQPPLKGP
jgi:hypothetical protein